MLAGWNITCVKAKANPPASATNGAVAHAEHFDGAALDPSAPQSAVKLSVNVTRDLGMRLRRLAFDERVSESSIVEIALDGLFADRGDAQLGNYLREHGASLRRPVRDERF